MIAIIDSGGANIASIQFALERLGYEATLTADPLVIRGADRVILPGVGAAAAAMGQLNTLNLIETIRGLTQPVLGICLGMQLLFDHSDEGDVEMLGIMPGRASHFTPAENKTIPHMGWNSVSVRSDHPFLAGIDDQSYFYFVHSYYAPVSDYTIGSCDYGDQFSAIVARDNFMGCQFHPERSGKIGAQILKNFMEISL